MAVDLLPLRDASAVCCETTAHDAAIGTDEAESLARELKALADPARIRILSIVAAHADQEACVCDLQEPLGLSQPTVSHHLKVLTTTGFLSRTQRGSWAYYRLVPGSLDRVNGFISAL